MYNYFMLIGKLDSVYKDANQIVIKVNRPFKNNNGEIESDNFTINVLEFLWDTINENLENTKPVSVKGRIQLTEDGIVKLIAERVIFM